MHMRSFVPLALIVSSACTPATVVDSVAVDSDSQPARRESSLRLFDGESLDGWEVANTENFQWGGEVGVRDGAIHLVEGGPYTGIRYPGDVPVSGFEVELDAMRTAGRDIFCGLTVPVGSEHVTLVLGGWGDCVVGLSNVDSMNASENESTFVRSFENDRWYRVKLRVDSLSITAWIDGEEVVNQERLGHTFSIYGQLRPITPLGFFTWITSAALRDIRLREVRPDGH